MDQDKIGNFIKSIRLENNLTQKELADRLGVTYQAVSKWENGKNVPDIGIMKQISEEFNVNIDEILNGEKSLKKENSNKWYIALIPVLILVLGIILVSILNKPKDFEFKTISSKCSDFKITGSAAYNKDKTSIYISNIEFCGNNSEEKYKKINCKLYENNNDTKIKISECKEKKDINIVEYLKDTNINVNNYNSTCKRLTSNTLILEIYALDNNNKTIHRTTNYKPIELIKFTDDDIIKKFQKNMENALKGNSIKD